MESKVNEIDLTIVEVFKGRFPGISVNGPKWAVDKVTKEFRKMEVGDVTLFPIGQYNYNTVRSAPKTNLLESTLVDGMSWSTSVDKGNKSIAVIRTA